MPKYVVERDIPGVGRMTAEELVKASRESNDTRDELGAGELQWVTSYITDDKIYCVYIARDEDVLVEHARCLDIPANVISRVTAVTDPATAEAAGAPAH